MKSLNFVGIGLEKGFEKDFKSNIKEKPKVQCKKNLIKF